METGTNAEGVAMQDTLRQRRAGTAGAAFVTVLGGGAATGAAFLVWSSLDIRPGLAVRGTRLPAGKVALIGGIVLVLLGVGLWLVQAAGAGRWLAVSAVVIGALVVGAAIAELESDATALVQELLQGDRAPGAGRRGAGLGLRRGLAGPATGAGVYLALTGGLVALAGGVAGLFWTTVPAPVPVVPPRASAETTTTETSTKERTD
jgi:hypothetical protein